jgi:hypothetical protein
VGNPTTPVESAFEALAATLEDYYLHASRDAHPPRSKLEAAERLTALTLGFQLGLEIGVLARDQAAATRLLMVMESFEAAQHGLAPDAVLHQDQEEAGIFLTLFESALSAWGSTPPSAPPAAEDAQPCRSCGAMVVFRKTKNDKWCPMDVDLKTGAETAISHFSTCPNAKSWSRSSRHGGKERGR